VVQMRRQRVRARAEVKEGRIKALGEHGDDLRGVNETVVR
jgi:hypothetical protein